MSRISRHRAHSITTPGQMFRAVAAGAAFALILVWVLQETPGGVTQGSSEQVLADR